MYTYEQIISDLKKKIYHPIYFLMGEEGYFIDEITNFIEKNVLDEAEKSFNQSTLYGRDTDLTNLLNLCRKFPMGANYNVILLKEAQALKGIEGSPSGVIDPFLLYAENPLKSTILVVNLREKSLDKRKKLYKILDKNACLFESKKIYENKVGSWISQYLKNKGYTIDLKACELMASYLGNDLSKVSNEIEKLLLTQAKGSTIGVREIEDKIGISKDFNVFELQNAIGERNFVQAMTIVTYLAQNPKTKSIIPLIALLYSYFSKILLVHYAEDKSQNSLASTIGIHPYFVKDYLLAAKNYPKAKTACVIGILRYYDAMSKGIDSPTIDDGELMKEMIFKILST